MSLLRSKTAAVIQKRFQMLPTASPRVDTVLVQGGAGNIPDAMAERKLQGVQTAAREAYITLKETGNVLDAVERAIKSMEKDEFFNAGYGSYLTQKGEVEMDAGIMEGSELTAGACCTVKDIRHPITLARLIMVKTKHVMLVGDGAMKFAHDNGFVTEKPGSLIAKSSQSLWEKYKAPIEGESGAVGAVVCDKLGHLAAGVSVGGRNRKVPGECDASYLGSGIYADNSTGAVCCTGDGAGLAKMCLAFSIAKTLPNMPVEEVIQCKLNTLESRLNQKAGVITISKTGEIGIAFTTPHMVWAYQNGRSIFYGMKKDEILETKL